MVTDLRGLGKFLTDSYCEKINEFVGEEIIYPNTEAKGDMLRALELIHNKIFEVERKLNKTCCRSCPIRKEVEDEKTY